MKNLEKYGNIIGWASMGIWCLAWATIMIGGNQVSNYVSHEVAMTVIITIPVYLIVGYGCYFWIRLLTKKPTA